MLVTLTLPLTHVKGKVKCVNVVLFLKHSSKVLSNMPVTLTSLLTHIKDEVKRGGCAILLVVFKDEAEYEIFTLTTLLNAVKGDNKNAMNFGLISKVCYQATAKTAFTF